MKIIKSNSGRKKLSDELRRTHEFTLMLNDDEYEQVCFLRNRFGSRVFASFVRSSIESAYEHQHNL